MPPENYERDDGNLKSQDDHRQPSHTIFAIPAPIKQLFDKFPLLTYSANDLPLRAPRNRNSHVLHVFSTEDDAAIGAPSYNPACLKWQTYLKFSNIDFRLASSNNHASPSGALPFLLPSVSDTAKSTQPIPSSKLQRWSMDNSTAAVEEPSDLRYEAYLSLLDHRIRRAWLYSIYLSANSASIAEPLYILPPSRNPFVRLVLARDLHTAAQTELLKFSAVINAEELFAQADEAFTALEMALGSDSWFFGAASPGLFDASVFAYTHLLMDDRLGNGWLDARLRNALLQRKNLVSHRARILAAYYADAGRR